MDKEKQERSENTESENIGLSMEVYKHFGLDLLKMGDEGREHEWGICKKENADKCTRNMVGFGMEQSQRIIIDYDKDYDWVLVRREKRKAV